MSTPFTVRAMLGRAIGLIVETALAGVQPRVIYDGEGKTQYLSRFYLVGAPSMPDGSSPFDRFGNPKEGSRFDEKKIGVYIHKFHRSDVDRECHSHPWQWAFSFVIAGGYLEERRVDDHVAARVVPPLSFNFLRADDYHRVDLLEDDAWTLFIVGPKVASWAFWNRLTGETTPWREFLKAKQRGVQP